MKNIKVDRKTDHVIEIAIEDAYLNIVKRGTKVYIQMTVNTAKEIAPLIIGALPTLEPFEEIDPQEKPRVRERGEHY